MAFQNAHFSRVRAFRHGKPPIYFVANYVQYLMRSAILRNHLKKNIITGNDYMDSLNLFRPGLNWHFLNAKSIASRNLHIAEPPRITCAITPDINATVLRITVTNSITPLRLYFVCTISK